MKTPSSNIPSIGPLYADDLHGQALKPDKIFILSALHHLLDLDTEIEPYDVTLSYVSPDNRKKKPNLKVLTNEEANLWGTKVCEELKKVADIKNDRFIVLAGQSYLTPIQNCLTHIEEPLNGIVQGKRPTKLKELMKELNGK